MRLSVLDQFSDEQTLSGTSVNSTNTLDFGAAGIASFPAKVVVRPVASVTGLSTVTLQGSEDNSTWSTVSAAGAVNGAAEIAVPQGCPRYTRLVYAGSSMSGKVSAGFTLCADSPAGKRIGNYAAN